jgi:dihydrofolate synthase / folylpolyglutamate synthase
VTEEEAERYLLSLELFGMRFGLDRMRRLMVALDHPEWKFRSIHVVGTNGKSSTARMIAAILEAHGVRTGTYLSPHLVSFAERVRVGDEDVPTADFAAAVQRAARAAALVDRTLDSDDRVTQFEALTAAAYSELARRGVEVAVIEAGLGGRYDATNVIPSEVQVLTNVGLEHTRWLGPTITDIAREKLAVVQDGATLVVGELHADAEREAVAAAERHAARLVHAPSTVEVPLPAYQRRNFALARAAAEAYLGQLDEDAVQRAALNLTVPGRLQRIGERPLTLLDGAHNPDGAAALAEALAELGDRWTVLLSILDDKDAAGMLRALLPSAERVILTRTSNPRALSPATLQSLARQIAGAELELAVEPDPRRALDRAREQAGPDGRVVATGSIYLVADLLRPPGARAVSML